jgi:muscleblind protein
VVPGQVPAVNANYSRDEQLYRIDSKDYYDQRMFYNAATNPYLGVTSQAYNPYFAAGPLVPLVSDPTGGGVVSPLGVPQQTVVAQQKVPRDRLETYPGMVAYKRPAGDKSGVPVYQPANTSSAAAYQHLMQLQQPFVPVSFAGHPPGVPRF